MPSDEPEPPEEPEDAGKGEIVLHGSLNPWEKRPSETSKAYEAFTIYRDSGPSRALRATAKRLGKDAALIARWSSRHDWVERVEMYDAEMDRRYREAREAASIEVARRQAAEGARLQLIGMERIRGNPERGIPALNPSDLSPNDVARFIELGVRIERLGMGLPTDLLRGAYSLSIPEFLDVMRKVIDLAIRFIPEERHDSFMTAVEGLGSG